MGPPGAGLCEIGLLWCEAGMSLNWAEHTQCFCVFSFGFCDDWAGDYKLDVIRFPAHSPTQPHTPCLTSERDACYLYALQDVGFSYMTDPRHLKDTLFICFESDFRFYKADDLPPETWLPLAVAPSEESAPGAQPESGASRPLEASSASGSRDTPPTLMPAVQLRPDADSLGRWKSITTLPRPYKTGYSVVTDELADLVQLATVASRQGVGDLIWFGHNAGHENKPRRRSTSPSDARGSCTRLRQPFACSTQSAQHRQSTSTCG
jgi:hypothetical protein